MAGAAFGLLGEVTAERGIRIRGRRESSSPPCPWMMSARRGPDERGAVAVSRRRPRVCVITGFGINADEELALAFELAGGEARRVHVTDLIAKPDLLAGFRILAFPGGFSFGDHLGSGKVFATLFRRNLGPALAGFVAGGGLVVGICNGFQVLVKMGVLPNLSGTAGQEVSLVHNDSGKYEDRWVRVRFERGSRCLWTSGLPDMDLPGPPRRGEVRHRVPRASLRAFCPAGSLPCATHPPPAESRRIPEDPNGSEGHVAGICDPTGRVFGLMPHPEAFIHPYNHPEWTARLLTEGEGLRIFANGVSAAALRRALDMRGVGPYYYGVFAGGVAQLARALEWHSRGRGFNSRRLH